MSTMPRWSAQLQWSEACPSPASTHHRSHLARRLGCGVFTADGVGLHLGRVLHIGKAENLRRHLSGCLVDYKRAMPTRPKGRAFIFEYRGMTEDIATFVRSVGSGGCAGEPEAKLCELPNRDCLIAWSNTGCGMTTGRSTRGGRGGTS